MSALDNVSLPTGTRVDGQGLVELICEQIGYGRVQQIAQDAWRRKLLASGSSEFSAALGSRTACVWCYVDSRTGNAIKEGFE